MRGYITKGREAEVQQWIKDTKQEGMSVRIDDLSTESYVHIVRTPFYSTFALQDVPDGCINRWTSRECIANPRFVRKDGIYKLGDAEIDSQTSSGATIAYVTAPTIEALQAIYFAYRRGELLPVEDWEAPQLQQGWNTVDPSKVIREVCPTSKRVVLRTECYTHKLEYFHMLFALAKQDFPELKPEDVEVVHFGGDRYAKTDGIEFEVDLNTVPENYSEISQLEFTR